MSHRTEAKTYKIYAVYNKGETRDFVTCTTLNEIPPSVHDDDDYGIAMYLAGYRHGVESIINEAMAFEFEESK